MFMDMDRNLKNSAIDKRGKMKKKKKKQKQIRWQLSK